jgi:hypothetical protein
VVEREARRELAERQGHHGKHGRQHYGEAAMGAGLRVPNRDGGGGELQGRDARGV